MRVKLFTFRYSSTLGGFDDTALHDFVRDKEVLSFREHFFLVNEVPHVTGVLSYQDAVVPVAVLEAAHDIPRREERPTRSDRYPRGRAGERADVTAGLSEPERVLFNTLREWRSRKAHDEGVPPFLIFTNREFLEIVRKRPESPNALGQLHGIGPGKVKRHGAEVLAIVRRSSAAAGPPAESAQPPAEVKA